MKPFCQGLALLLALSCISIFGAEFLVFVAEGFGALVTMQDGRAGMFAERIQQCFVGELATMAQAETPTNNLPRLEIQ